VFEETRVKELAKASCYSRQLLKTVGAIYIWFSDKMRFTLATLKN